MTKRIKNRLHKIIDGESGLIAGVLTVCVAVLSWLCVNTINDQKAIVRLTDTTKIQSTNISDLKYSVDCLALPHLGVDTGDKDCAQPINITK